MLEQLDGGGPPDEPPSSGPAWLADGRGFARPDGAWFNRASMGRPTYAEAVFAACCIVGTNMREDIVQLVEVVEQQKVQWSQQGDAWSPPLNQPPEWANGGVVCRVLENALAARDLDWARVGEQVWKRAKVELASAPLYLTKVRGGQKAKLLGPNRGKSRASPRWRAALPEIAGILSDERARCAIAAALRPDAATPAPNREELREKLEVETAVNRCLRAELQTAHAAKRKARFDAREAGQLSKRRKVDLRKEGAAKLKARIAEAQQRAKERGQQQFESELLRRQRLKNEALAAKRAALERAAASDELASKRLKRLEKLEEKLQERTAECEELKAELKEELKAELRLEIKAELMQESKSEVWL